VEDCQVEMKNQHWTYCTTRQYRLSDNSQLEVSNTCRLL